MPQFEMPFDGHDDYVEFKKLDSFTQGYIEAIYWTECNSDQPELAEMNFADMAASTLAAIVEDCRAFQAENADDLTEACDNGRIDGYDMHRAGVDYWLTRNRHGAGFWDRGLGDVGDKLSDAAKADGSRDVYAGDDGKLYVSN